MKKSNWIIFGVLVVISAFLLWLWYYLGFNKVDNPFDLVLSIVWWIGVALLCYLVYRAEKKRQEQIRTIYVSPNALFNCERGLVECPDPEKRVSLMEEILDNLEYNFHKEDMPKERDFEFKYVVRTEDFKEKDSKDDDAQEAQTDAAQDDLAAKAEAPVETMKEVSAEAAPAVSNADSDNDDDEEQPKWKGTVVKIDYDQDGHQQNEENDFDGRDELTMRLAS